MSEIHLTAPVSVNAGVAYDLDIIQEIQGVEASVAGVQFSNYVTGPWTTARAPGGGGAVEAAAVPWTAATGEWIYEGVISHEVAWIRVGVWADQSLTGPPALFSNASRVLISEGA